MSIDRDEVAKDEHHNNEADDVVHRSVKEAIRRAIYP